MGYYRSSWTSYPDHYKFFSLQINVSDETTYQHRATYELLEFLGDVGGLLGFFIALIGALISWLSQSKITSLIANRFYTSPTSYFQFDKTKINQDMSESQKVGISEE